MKFKGKYILFGAMAAMVLVGGVLLEKKIEEKVTPRSYFIKPSVTENKTLVPTKVEIKTVPTIKPPSFNELNAKYGPCFKTSVLMYHHIQGTKEAVKKGQGGLSVSPEYFEKHMEYLKTKGYTVVGPEDVVAAFEGTSKLSDKSVLITLDDAYEDNYTNAFPILKKYGYKATIFTPTGLVTVNDYLNWSQIREMSESGLVYFGNHTWSHHGSAGKIDVIQREVSIADTQLRDKGLNSQKVFAYPYGKPSTDAKKVLKEMNYSMAFTTTHGNVLCKGQRYELPRVRMGNAPLSNYGL